jgi:hypothetical protein
MKIKIAVLFFLLVCELSSQSIIDTSDVDFGQFVPVKQDSMDIESNFEKLSNTVYSLNNFVKEYQLFTNKKLDRLEYLLNLQSKNLIGHNDSLIEIFQIFKKDIVLSMTKIDEKVISKISDSNSHLILLKNMIDTLTDSLLTDANNILRIKQQNSFNEAFLMARLKLGPNQKFEWNGKIYKTDYDDEMLASPIVIAIDSLKFNLEKKSEQLDNAIYKANSQIITLDSVIQKANLERENQIILLDESITKTISERTIYWVIAILLILICVASIFFFLKSMVAQQQDSISFVKDTQDKLENEAIQLDTKLIQILEQKLVIAQHKPQQTKEIDHSLPLKLGEEIHRMRKRLKTMEESQGTKVLNKRIESLEEKINDMGYKIINLEGKPFNDGMTLQAHFVADENLEDGESIIKRVIKPQINFNENLIQVAEVEVAQGV